MVLPELETLKLTTRVLMGIHKDLIHPLIINIFQHEIPIKRIPMTEMITLLRALHEIRNILVLPIDELLADKPLSLISGITLLFLYCLRESKDHIKLIIDTWLKKGGGGGGTDRIFQFYLAYEDKFDKKHIDEKQTIIFDIILLIIKWEFKDRCNIVIKILNLPPYIDDNRGSIIALGFAHHDERWVNEYSKSISLLLACPSRELIRKMKPIRYDLALFVTTLRGCTFNDNTGIEEQQFYIDFKDKTSFSSIVSVRFFIAMISIFSMRSLIAQPISFPLLEMDYENIQRLTKFNLITPSEYIRYIINI